MRKTAQFGETIAVDEAAKRILESYYFLLILSREFGKNPLWSNKWIILTEKVLNDISVICLQIKLTSFVAK